MKKIIGILAMLIVCVLVGCSSGKSFKTGEYNIPYAYKAEKTGSIAIQNVELHETYRDIQNAVVVKCAVEFSNFKKHVSEYGTSVVDADGNTIDIEKIYFFDDSESFMEIVYSLKEASDLSSVDGVIIGAVQNQKSKDGHYTTRFPISK